MIFYEKDTWIFLITSLIPGISSIYFFFRGNLRRSIFLLVVTALVLRLGMISLDPYLKDWDERFHALVAKNMVNEPFRPKLREEALLPYNVEDWRNNHIWTHKQPLFLWQMALSIKLFGTTPFAVRLPSALLTSLEVLLIFQIAFLWTKNHRSAYIAAFLFTFSYFSLEIITGGKALDHNDAIYGFYITCSIWAWTEHLFSEHRWRWAVLIGVFVGMAILVKWLTAFVIFGSWGLYLFLSPELRTQKREWFCLISSFLVCLTVFLPWQIYIRQQFPLESSISYNMNRRHIFEVLDGQTGDWSYHIFNFPTLYGSLGAVLFIIGVYFLFKEKVHFQLSTSMLAMILVFILFFTFVKTKMIGFMYPMHAIVWAIVGFGTNQIIQILANSNKVFRGQILTFLLLVPLSIFTFSPWKIARFRSDTNKTRNIKIENTKIYLSEQLSNLSGKGYVILHIGAYEFIELMFFQDVAAYQTTDKAHFKTILKQNKNVAAFIKMGPYELNADIKNNPEVVILTKCPTPHF